MPKPSGGPLLWRGHAGFWRACRPAGRGRRARPWAVPAGNFHATLVLRVTEPPATVALRSFAAALALRDAFVALTGLPDSLRAEMAE